MADANSPSKWEEYLSKDKTSELRQKQLFYSIIYPPSPHLLPSQEEIDEVIKAEQSVQQSRLSVCSACPNFNAETKFCNLSQSNMELKVMFPFSACPIDKWT
jgi:hypothetical protein